MSMLPLAPVFHRRLLGHRLLLGGLLIALLLAVAYAPAAQAAFSSCRADPVFVLSDGTIIDVQVDIDTSVTNVEEIHYIVRGPRGVTLVTALATPTLGFTGLETITYIADQAPNQYVTDTVVRTSVPRVRATSYTTFAANSLLQLQLRLSAQYQVIEGWAGQHLIARLSK